MWRLAARALHAFGSGPASAHHFDPGPFAGSSEAVGVPAPEQRITGAAEPASAHHPDPGLPAGSDEAVGMPVLEQRTN
eukprot:13150853-Alexandrium_andersonii.AAC.1